MKKDFSDQSYLFSLSSLKKERRKMISDSLGQSLDLYEAMYECNNSALRAIEFKRYELLILKRYWEDNILKISRLPESEYYAILKLFTVLYRNYVNEIMEGDLDGNYLDVSLECLEEMINTNKNWEESVKKIKIELIRNKKVFDDRINELKKNV